MAARCVNANSPTNATNHVHRTVSFDCNCLKGPGGVSHKGCKKDTPATAQLGGHEHGNVAIELQDKWCIFFTFSFPPSCNRAVPMRVVTRGKKQYASKARKTGATRVSAVAVTLPSISKTRLTFCFFSYARTRTPFGIGKPFKSIPSKHKHNAVLIER